MLKLENLLELKIENI